MKITPESSLKQCGVYIIEDNLISCKNMYKIEVINVTDTSYELKFQHVQNTRWIKKSKFVRDYKIVEDISEKKLYDPSLLINILKPLPDELNILNTREEKYDPVLKAIHADIMEYEDCAICRGEGTVYDPSSTAGIKTCPRCYGSKRTVKYSGNVHVITDHHGHI